MIRYRVKSYAPIVLFVAMLFAVGNLAHSLEHDYDLRASQAHAECNHCSGEQSVAVSPPTLVSFTSLSEVHYESISSGFIATSSLSFQARAPPLR